MEDRLADQPMRQDSAEMPDACRDSFPGAIDAARAGDREALGLVVAPFRSLLLLIAERELSPELKAKEGASDLVQDTLVEAQQNFAAFRGRTSGELRAWLCSLLRHRVLYTSRRYRKTAKRRLSREMLLPQGAISADLADALMTDSTSPSGRAVRDEEQMLVLAALERLPESMRQVIVWRHSEECTFEEIGRRLGRSDSGVRKLWLRAIERLREEMTGGHRSSDHATPGPGP